MSEYQFATDEDLDLEAPPRTKRLVAALVVGLHVVVVLGLIQAFAPGFTAQVTEQVISTFTVTVITPPPPKQPAPKPPPPRAPVKPGAAAPVGKKAVPKAAAAPKPRVVIARQAAPPIAGKGNANSAGAAAAGLGTGAGGQGNGTGSGAGGDGRGGGMVTRPSVRSGELNNAADFPAPPGGREARFGKSVTVTFIVTTDGRARNCTVARSNVDPGATALVCPLVIRKIRFNAAKRRDGSPIEARYGYKVDFRER